MNPKVTKARRDVERAERKLAELTAELKELRAARTKIEDAEAVKRIRSASAKSGLDIEEILSLLESGSAPDTAAHAGADDESEVE